MAGVIQAFLMCLFCEYVCVVCFCVCVCVCMLAHLPMLKVILAQRQIGGCDPGIHNVFVFVVLFLCLCLCACSSSHVEGHLS